MQMTARLFDSPSDDAKLVAQSLAGSRDAFARIVARYQSLVCSIGYSATGNLSQSEDLAQETFISAWKQLRDLRDPDSLRAWLCGIARNVAQNTRRRDGREPAHAADPIDATFDAAAADAPPHEQAISDEEQAILWRSIAHIPPLYREPLVLFYREQQSIEAVAAAFNLSEEAVKQRLSRGRKLLQEQIASFVEGALARSAPNAAFTLAVVAALPGTTASATAAVIGASAAKGSALAKWAGIAAMFNALTGLAFGFFGSYLGYRIGLETTRTPRERALLHGQMRGIAWGLAFFVPALFAFTFAGPFWAGHPQLFMAVAIALPLALGAWIIWTILASNGAAAALRETERKAHPELFAGGSHGGDGYSEFRSRAALFGWPLLHVQFGVPPSDVGPARGWIAIGPAHAIGIVYAMGTTSIGGISVGALSCGIVSIGSVSVGLVSLATIALGWLAFGGIAIGDYAIGGFAAAWSAAAGGLAVAHDIAGGGFAIAVEHANDLVARNFFQLHRFDFWFRAALTAFVVLMGVPGIAYVIALKKRRRSPL